MREKIQQSHTPTKKRAAKKNIYLHPRPFAQEWFRGHEESSNTLCCNFSPLISDRLQIALQKCQF